MYRDVTKRYERRHHIFASALTRLYGGNALKKKKKTHHDWFGFVRRRVKIKQEQQQSIFLNTRHSKGAFIPFLFTFAFDYLVFCIIVLVFSVSVSEKKEEKNED